MKEEQGKMDYNKEVENLNSGGDTWKPKVGVHNFVILSEPEETAYIEDGKEPTPQIKIEIEIKGEKKNWFVSKGKTMKSAYGQLMVIGKYYNKLTGVKMELIVQESKDKNGEVKNSYMFPMAAKIAQTEAENEDKTDIPKLKPQTPPTATEETVSENQIAETQEAAH